MNALYVGRIGSEVPESGTVRVLVDRLWPRGVRKEEAPWDRWLKELAPSSDLRKWYAHDPARNREFRLRYRAELSEGGFSSAMQELITLWQSYPVQLVTATRDLTLSHVPELKEFVRESYG